MEGLGLTGAVLVVAEVAAIEEESCSPGDEDIAAMLVARELVTLVKLAREELTIGAVEMLVNGVERDVWELAKGLEVEDEESEASSLGSNVCVDSLSELSSE